MPDHGRRRVHLFRDHVVAGVNWRPTRFVDAVPSSCACGLCRIIPKQMVVLPCGHALCQSCHAASLEGGVGQCPLDQEQFEEAECLGYEFPTRIANTFKVHCWNEEHGCEYTGTMDRMLEHYENECTFHTVECLRCGEGVQHRELPAHYVAGCTARVSGGIRECASSERTALTLEDVNAALEDLKALLGDANHDRLLPVIQSQLNELTEQVRNQGARFALITRALGASEHTLESEIPLENRPEEASTSSSLSLRSEKALILRKLEHFTNLSVIALERSRQTLPQPDSIGVIAHCEPSYSGVRHFTSALSTTPARIKEIWSLGYVLTLENCYELDRWEGPMTKFAQITMWHMRDTYFTLAVWKNCNTSDLILKIKFCGVLEESRCLPPIWRVKVCDIVGVRSRLLTSFNEPCDCGHDETSLVHFHLGFRKDIHSLKNDGFLRDGKMRFKIELTHREMSGGVSGAPNYLHH
ncbi:uncharacterized protein [Dermacentor andersoni]|uniref:uncharacterized protein isoform X3 n=1 Tax=Dermacentor andersoni TaxID=34620 RepID=UPI003B3BE40D